MTATYDHNPTTHRRVIFDGIEPKDRPADRPLTRGKMVAVLTLAAVGRWF